MIESWAPGMIEAVWRAFTTCTAQGGDGFVLLGVVAPEPVEPPINRMPWSSTATCFTPRTTRVKT